MPLVVTRTTTLFTDIDENSSGGQPYDVGDTLYHRVDIQNTGTTVNNAMLTDTLNGSTIVAGTLNVTPIANNDAYAATGNTLLEVGEATNFTGIQTSVSANILGNDVDALGGAFKITAVQAATAVSSGAISTLSAQGGAVTVVVDGANAGSFSYVSAPGFVGTDTFTYTIRDAGSDGVAGNSDDLSTTATVTITVTSTVWYVDSAAAPGGNGTSSSPFKTVAEYNAVDVDDPGDIIYMRGTQDGTIVLESGQQLIGNGADLFVNGVTLASAGANSTLSAASGTIVTLNSGNTIAGLTIGNDAGTATGISGSNFGTLTVNGVVLDTGGQALSLSTGSFTGSGFTATSSNGGSSNVALTNVTGTIALGNSGGLTGATGDSFFVSGSTSGTTVTYGGSITHAGASGALINVQGGHTGTLTLTGALGATGGTGLQFNNADGTYNLNGNTVLNGGDAGIDITNNSTGTFNFGVAGSTTTTITSPTGAAFLMDSSNANVTYNGAITQANNAAMVDITNHSGSTVTFQNGTLSATNGTGIQLSNADGTYNFNGTTTLNGGDAGVDIDTGSSGTFNFGVAGVTTTTITHNNAGDAFVVDGVSGTPSNATVTYNGTITDNNGNAVFIDEHDAGTITFQNGSINSSTAAGSGIDVTNSNGGTINFNSQVTLSTGANTGILLTTNNGSAINFNPTGTGLDITTSSGTGFIATNGGTITIADSGSGNSITVTAGAGGAVGFSATGGTTIGAGGVTFDSINQTGGTSGIVLNGTGTGAFTVLGDGSQTSSLFDRDGSGGTISGTSSHAIHLTNASNVTIRQMNLTNPTGDGVNSSGGGSIRLQAVNIDAGGGDGWEAINLGGVNEFTHNSRVTDWQAVQSRGITVTNTNTNFTSFTISNALFTTSATGADGFLFDAEGSTSGSISVTNSEFTLLDDDAVQINNDGSGTINARVNNNNFHDADNTSGDGNNTVFLALGGSGTLNFEVINNDFTNLARIQAGTGALAVNAATTNQTGSRLNGFIEDNVFTNIFRRDAISFAIEASGGTQGTHTIEVENNSGTNIGLTALRLLVNSVAGGSVTAFNLRYIGNNFSNLGTSPLVTDDSRSGIDVETNWDNFASGGDLTTNLLFQNNNITNNGTASGVSDTFDLTNRGGDVGTNGTMNLTMLGNNFTNTGGPHGIDILNSPGTSATGSGATLNLDINSDNISPNNTTTTNGAGGSIQVRNTATGGPFRIEDLGANAVNTFVSTRNSGDTVTSSGTITSTGDVTMPTPPSAFIIAEAPPPAPPADTVPADEPPADEPSVADPPAEEPPAEEPGDTGSTPPPVVVVDDGILTEAELGLIVEAAIQRWADAGATAEQIAAMRAVTITVEDLAGLQLGESSQGAIRIDKDAAGWSWFVDATPGDDSEYEGSGTLLGAVDKMGVPGTRIDLLTVVMHELGHQIGLSDMGAADDRDELMAGTIGAGERRLPGADDAAGGGTEAVTGSLAIGPHNIGTIPAGTTISVTWHSTVDNPPEDRLVSPVSGTTTVDGFSSNTNSNPLDSLTIGNLVFLDVNKDGDFDSGVDSGIAGVTLTLFADTDNDGVYTAGIDQAVSFIDNNANGTYEQGTDTPTYWTDNNSNGTFEPGTDTPAAGIPLTVTTDANGVYSFGNLAPGDYIVRINAANFTGGGALNGKALSTFGGADPDDNLNNDNNGVQGTGIVVSRALTVGYGAEPVDDGDTDADTNRSVDFAFEQPNQAPTGTSLTFPIDEDTSRTLDVTDFGYGDADGNALLEIQINSVTGGTLTVNGTPVTTFPATITPAQLDADQVVFTPTQHLNGATAGSIDFQVRDNGGTDNGGVDTDQSANTLTFNIAAVNDPVTTAAPTILAVDEDTPKAVTGLSISDVDAALAPGGVYVVTLSSTNGTMSLSTITGLTFSAGDGTADATMTFRGTLANINTALATASYRPATNYSGPADITLQATDTFGGTVATGTGAETNDSDSVAVTVTAFNDAPTVSIVAPLAPSGGQVPVNATTAGSQTDAATAGLIGGGYVVAWYGAGAGDTNGVFIQRYDASGVAQGGETLVNTTTANSQILPSVAALSGGGFVVTWQGEGTGDGSGIFAQRYNAAGVAQGGEVLVNTTVTGGQTSASVAALSDGGYVVTWSGNGPGDAAGIFAQRYDASGVAQGGEVLVNTTTASAQTDPSVGALSGGGYVVTWQGNGAGDTGGVFARRYDASGVPQGGEVLVNSTTAGAQIGPDIAGLNGGGYVIVWHGDGASDSSPSGTFAQRYDASGVPLGGEVRVTVTTLSNQIVPSVTPLTTGGYVVTWYGVGPDDSWGVFGRHFDAAGEALTGELRLNTIIAGEQYNPAVAGLASGGFVAAWHGNGTGDGLGIHARRYEPVDGTFTAVEQNALNLKGTISVGDVDSGAATVTATLSVGYGILNVNAGGSGASVASGNGTGTVTVSGTIAQIQALLRTDATSTITYTANTDAPPGSTPLTVTVNDGGASGQDPGLTGTAASEQGTDSETINITAVNDAPVLADVAVAMTGQGQDDPPPVGAVGTLVSSLVDLASVAGGRDNVSDPDSASIGIAITAANTSDGTFHYSVDGGTSWQPLGAVSGSSALLLGPNDRLYFQPNAGFAGTIADAITFRAWDMSSGSAGNLVDTTANGGDTAFSTATDQASLAVGVLNVAPVIDLNGAASDIHNTASYSENDPPSVLAAGLTVSDTDDTHIESATVSIGAGFIANQDLLTVNGSTGGTLNGITFAYNATTGVLSLSGSATKADYEATLRLVGFESTSHTPGTSRSISWKINDGTADSAAATTTLGITELDDTAVAADDDFTTDEVTPFSDDLFADNGSGEDDDPDTATLTVATVNNDSNNVDSQFELPSGALLTVRSDGTFDYDPNGAFDALSLPSTGGTNNSFVDSFTYTLVNGDEATVEILINAVDNDDDIIGSASGDTLIADGGTDDMFGLTGNDLYFVNSAGDTVNETAGNGKDVVLASVSYALLAGSSVESLTANPRSSIAALDLTGNELSQSIYGNQGANVIDGGGGADTMFGFGGNDTYYADTAGDIVVEAAGEGKDVVHASTSYTLAVGSEIEVLVARLRSSTAAQNLTGNAFNQSIYGSMGANLIDGLGGADAMFGFGGDDSYFVDHAGDVAVEAAGEGNDTVFTSVNYQLGANIEVLIARFPESSDPLNLAGNGSDNSIYGTAGNNSINGGAGADLMVGFAGDDIYFVDNAGDFVVEAAGEGHDVVLATVNYALASGTRVEVLAAQNQSSAAAIDLTGNQIGQAIYGSVGANVINGKGGVDVLFGFGGADQFVFDTSPAGGNFDYIADFETGVDKIVLDNAVYTALSDGALPATAFHMGTAAADADDRIIYNPLSGEMYYDADGSGSGAQVLVAVLQAGLPLTATDFTVI